MWSHSPRAPQVYTWCLEEHRADFAFMLFLDVDEFLVIRNGRGGAPVAPAVPPAPIGHVHPSIAIATAGEPRLRAALEHYRHAPAVILHWIMVGPSGHKERPADGGVLRHYTQCVPEPDVRIKTLVNTFYVDGISPQPHNFWYRCVFDAAASLAPLHALATPAAHLRRSARRRAPFLHPSQSCSAAFQSLPLHVSAPFISPQPSAC